MFTRSTIVKLVPGTISMYSLGEGGHCKDMGWGYVVQTLYRYWCERGLIQYDFVRILDIRAGGGLTLYRFCTDTGEVSPHTHPTFTYHHKIYDR
jgi:hypothetical protein